MTGLRVGLRERFSDEAVDPEILHALRRLGDLMEHLGATIVSVTEQIEAPLPIWRVLQHSIWAQRYGGAVCHPHLDPVIAEGIAHAQSLGAADLQAAFHGRTRLFRSVQGWFDTVDVVLSPTLTCPPLAAEHPGQGPMHASGREYDEIRAHWAPILGLYTMTGHPGVSFNCGWTASGLPIGAHMASRWHTDATLLDIVGVIEGAAPQEAWRLPSLASA